MGQENWQNGTNNYNNNADWQNGTDAYNNNVGSQNASNVYNNGMDNNGWQSVPEYLEPNGGYGQTILNGKVISGDQSGYNNQQNYRVLDENGRVVDVSQPHVNSTGLQDGLKHPDRLFFAVFFGVGFILLVVGILLGINSYKFKQKAVEVEAEIVDFERYYDHSSKKTRTTTYVSYEYEGEEYSYVQLGFYSSNMRIGKKITILCDPDNPGKIQAKSGGFFITIVMVPMGIVFMIIGIAVGKAMKG